MSVSPLPLDASLQDKARHYEAVLVTLHAILDGESDWVSAMATVACELHHAFEAYHWTGFYRAVDDQTLRVGPYQGGHGCLEIDFERGVCGAAARTRQTQLVRDVHAFEGHIACSMTTQSEVVVPVVTPQGVLLGVLDVDSDAPAAFDEVDQRYLEQLCEALGRQFSQQQVDSGARLSS